MTNDPTQETPLVRLQAHGPAALTDSELIALLLTPRREAAKIAAAALYGQRLSDFLGNPQSAELTNIDCARIRVVMELARRSLAQEMKARDSLTSPAAVRGYLRLRMQDLGHECFYTVFLDAQNRVIDAEELFRGSLTQTSVYPREVVKRALHHNAAALILAHNHPSGVAEPSIQDQALTRTLAEACSLVDVKILDHFIVVPGACLSFAERGLL